MTGSRITVLILQGLALGDESGNIPDCIQTGEQMRWDFDGGTLQKESWQRLGGGVSTGSGPAVLLHTSLLPTMVTRSPIFGRETVPVCEVGLMLSGVQGCGRGQVSA